MNIFPYWLLIVAGLVVITLILLQGVVISLFFIFIVNLLSQWFINFLDFLFKNKLYFTDISPTAFLFSTPLIFQPFTLIYLWVISFSWPLGYLSLYDRSSISAQFGVDAIGVSLFICSLRSLNHCSDLWHYFIEYSLHITTFQTSSVSFSVFKLVPVGMVYLLYWVCYASQYYC